MHKLQSYPFTPFDRIFDSLQTVQQMLLKQPRTFPQTLHNTQLNVWSVFAKTAILCKKEQTPYKDFPPVLDPIRISLHNLLASFSIYVP